ncbi:MAG: DUF4908 domain-containing protein [Alphaproteobacteria bacterium]|nr:DUF4908 domain-containing protein [Alphaproteobacteria bacterium]
MIRHWRNAALALAVLSASAGAQTDVGAKLDADRVGGVEPGAYTAGENIRFTLDPYGEDYLFRLDNVPEVFVLHADRASLGGRVLKYDYGGTALQVSGWGALTLYTDEQPAGLPAVREGDSTPPSPPQISLPDIQTAAQDESQHLAYAHQLHVSFTADWNALAVDSGARAVAFDELQNATRALDELATRDDAHNAMMRKIEAVKLVFGKPALAMHGKTLVMAVDPGRGFAGASSSRAILRSLCQILSLRQARNG